MSSQTRVWVQQEDGQHMEPEIGKDRCLGKRAIRLPHPTSATASAMPSRTSGNACKRQNVIQENVEDYEGGNNGKEDMKRGTLQSGVMKG